MLFANLTLNKRFYVTDRNKFTQISLCRVFLYGGSHGAFIVLHLAGKFPADFRALVARNPVVDKATKSQSSDIPDNGMLININSSGNPGPSAMSLLYNASPLSIASFLKIPIFLMIGASDRRVPPNQGFLLYHELKGMGEKHVKMNVYDDCLPLSKVSVHANVMINTALFFTEF